MPYYITADGKRHNGRPKAEQIGSFQGRAGSMRRSTKGRSYRMPNGSRRYIGPTAKPEEIVIAYKL